MRLRDFLSEDALSLERLAVTSPEQFFRLLEQKGVQAVRAAGAAIFLLAACGSPLLGQSAAERLAVDRWRDSLAGTTDTVGLRSLQRTLLRLAKKQPDSGLTQLRAGLVAFRRGELQADPDFSDATALLRKAAKRRPDWPEAWYALGVAEAARAEWEQADRLTLGSRVGVGTLERAAEDYRRALHADPGFVPAALALADLTLGLRDTALLGPARNALRRTARSAVAGPPELLLAWGRLERATGDPDSAAAAFEQFLAAGGARALGLLELARTHLAEGRPEGESRYYEGAALDDSAAAAEYRADLRPIAADSDLARLDALRGSERGEYLRRFWTNRDQEELRADGERLGEHYRRLLAARRDFALTVSRRFYSGSDAYRSGSAELDDRGIIYVRHGEPAERLRPFVFGLMPNETWRYARAEGDLLFHFSAGGDDTSGGDLYDYRLVESVLDLHGAAAAPPDQLLLSRQSLSPVYGRMLNWGPYGAARSHSRERTLGRVSIAFGTTTDSYELQFDRRLAAVANLIAVGGSGELRLAHLVFAIGEHGTAPSLADGAATYPVRVRLVALDGSHRPFARVDTSLVFRLGRPLGRGQYLIGRVELPLPPGFWSWRAAIEQGEGAGVVLPRDSVRVGRGGPALSLSDIALGVRQASAVWHPAPADTVFLTPFDLFREGGEVELYYEVGGAAAGAAYRHRIGVFRMNGDPPRADRRPVVTLGFEEKAAGPVIRSSRTLQLGRLKAGRYLVEVRVAGPDGGVETRRREFRVVKRE